MPRPVPPPLRATGPDAAAQWKAALTWAWQRGGYQRLYRAYTHSAPYRALRRTLREAVGGRCQRCQRDDAPLQVHHLHYRTAGAERLHDVRMLCQSCHTAVEASGFRDAIPPCAAQRESAKAAHEALTAAAPRRVVRRRPGGASPVRANTPDTP